MTINDFRGQVKIQDVQNAFDEIVSRINNQIDIYNGITDIQDIDLSKGSPVIASPNYTLTVGGLKQLIESFNGTLIGCKAFRINSNTVLVSNGLYFKDGTVYRIAARVVQGQSSWDKSKLYYDIDNNVVLFKDGYVGGTQEIVEVEQTWTQPSISSNTSFGTFTATKDSANAYKITNNTGWTAGLGYSGSVTWNFPKTLKISKISFYTGAISQGGSIKVYINNSLKYTYNFSSSSIETKQSTINVNISNVSGTSVKIEFNAKQVYDACKFSNLVVTAKEVVQKTSSGGVIQPSSNIIQLCSLNWASANSILNTINNKLQLENTGLNMKSQSRTALAGSYNNQKWESVDVSDSGKFVAYSSPILTWDSSSEGTCNFLGVTILDGRWTDSYRSHMGYQPIVMVYIPKGASSFDSHTGQIGRYVYTATIK